MTELTLPTPARCIKVLLAMVPLPPLPPLPPLFGGEDGFRSTNANSSPTALAHAVFRALKARASLNQPLPAGPAGGKDSKGYGGDNYGNASSSG